jgi:DNA replication protein DnaC
MAKPIAIQSILDRQKATLPLPEKSLPSAGDQPVCPICNGLGWLRDKKPRPFDNPLVRCSCKATEDATRLQNRIGSPMKEYQFSDIKTHARPGTYTMVQHATDFAAYPRGWLTIWGRNGTGKTMVLQAITHTLLARNYSALYLRAHDMVEFLKRGIGDEDYNVGDRVMALAAVRVLCIDEMSQINWTEWVSEQLESLLDLRYSNSLGTVLAMDEDPVTVFHARLLSRMRENTIVENQDSDFRPALGGVKV